MGAVDRERRTGTLDTMDTRTGPSQAMPLGRFDPKYLPLAEAVAQAINEADPIGLLAIGAPSDEYSPEHETILPRLADVRDEDGVAAFFTKSSRGGLEKEPPALLRRTGSCRSNLIPRPRVPDPYEPVVGHGRDSLVTSGRKKISP